MNAPGWVLIESEQMAAMGEMMLDRTMALFAEVAEAASEEDSDLPRRLKEFEATRKERFLSCHEPRGGFNCLLHNDAWCNNFMFR